MSLLWKTAVAPTPRPTFAVSGWNRCRPLGTCARRHRGLDFRARIGTDIFSILPGVVIAAKRDPGGDTGKMVAIQHEDGLVSRYLHLSNVLVNQGDFVSHGQRIAKSGDTGAPGQPHLHLDLFLPEDKVAEWEELFGRPATGFPKHGEGQVRVPGESIIPINGGNRHVFREAEQLGMLVNFQPFVRPKRFLSSLDLFRFRGFTGAEPEPSKTDELIDKAKTPVGLAVVGGIGGLILDRSLFSAAIGAGIGFGIGILLERRSPETTA